MNEASAITPEIIMVLGLLFLTVYLFVSEVVRIDVAAVTIMVALGLTTMVPGIVPVISTADLFNGFSSNAVMSIIAVMIIGAGLDKTGIMSRVANWILKHGGSTEHRITPMISGTVGIISSFMQNVGAAALFLPVVSRISRRTSIPMSRLLMPMGFCAILGGTVTMVGSSPLILLNDLLLSSNQALPPELQMETFDLFDVTPIGLALIATGILFFMVFGRFVLPSTKGEEQKERTTRTADYFERVYGISGELFELQATLDSPLVGMTIMQIERTLENVPFVLAIRNGDDVTVVPDSKEVIWVNSYIGVLSNKRQLVKFARKYKLRIVKSENHFASVMNATGNRYCGNRYPARLLTGQPDTQRPATTPQRRPAYSQNLSRRVYTRHRLSRRTTAGWRYTGGAHLVAQPEKSCAIVKTTPSSPTTSMKNCAPTRSNPHCCFSPWRWGWCCFQICACQCH